MPITATCTLHLDGEGNWSIHSVFSGTTPNDMDFGAGKCLDL